MRTIINMNQDWNFIRHDGKEEKVHIPHTWNAVDGQDGGDDYFRGSCHYTHHFKKPEFSVDTQSVYLQFHGINSSASVKMNGDLICTHEGGYSTFRVEITEHLEEENSLEIEVDNGRNERIYPQKADFTFYGGIYRDVEILIVSKQHFDLDYYGGKGVKVTPTIKDGIGLVHVESFINDGSCEVEIAILDGDKKEVAHGKGTDTTIEISNPHLWDGIKDPYLYSGVVTLFSKGNKVDEVEVRFGIRSFHIDPKKGFYLNGRAYPLRGVSRHQDWKGIGNAISKKEHLEDFELIREVGANTIRLAHYQHDQYFYDLCDEYGMIVWAEIPYISSHMESGRENTIHQMKELIVQNYNHPSIVTWGLSNEITIATKNKKDMLDNHHVLNDLCHKMDQTRPTTLACYAVCGPFNKVAHISDTVAWNLYLGWYVPGLFLNDLWIKFFHMVYPNRSLGYAEYGAEGMPNLHASRPKRGDNTEEYQAKYHEYMLKCFERHPYLWSTYVWNMFDFAADARNQGGEPGMNHKGLVTFDRKIKKDSFYLYKAYWSDQPFVHICGLRYVDRVEKKTEVKVYSNQGEVSLYQNGKLIQTQKGQYIYRFKINLEAENEIRVVSAAGEDTAFIRKVNKPNESYKLKEKGDNSANWV